MPQAIPDPVRATLDPVDAAEVGAIVPKWRSTFVEMEKVNLAVIGSCSDSVTVTQTSGVGHAE